MPEPKSLSVMDADKIDRSLTRIAHEIVERHRDVGRLVLVGIRTRGVPLAQRLQRKIGAIEGKDLPLGILDINLYRDDITSVGPSAILKETIIHFPIDDRPVWSIVCFVVSRPARRSGVARVLLDAAVAYARSHGAPAVEGYPIDTRGSRTQSAWLYTGTLSMFEAAGFHIAGWSVPVGKNTARSIVRLEL